MAKLIIIADDLTGALEAGVILRNQNIAVMVIPDYRDFTGHAGVNKKYQALVINSESRHISSRSASVRIRSITGKALQKGIRNFYKKTDSTMRGNIGAELESLMKSTAHDILYYIPAHPKLKRFTKGGRQYLGTTPLHKTRFAYDPREPVKTSYVPDILKAQTKLNIGKISGRKRDEFGVAGNKGINVVDCRSEDHMRMIYKFLRAVPDPGILAGTAGFCMFLPDLFELQPLRCPRIIPAGPVLVVNGSLNRVSLDQVKSVSKTGMEIFQISELINKPGDKKITEAWNKVTEQIINESLNGKNVLITSGSVNKQIHDSIKGINTERNNINLYELFSAGMGKLVSSVILKAEYKTLVVFGGDTLSGIIRSLKCKTINPAGEILDGIALSVIRVKNKELFLISKPGGYGARNAISEILNKVKKAS